MQAFSKSGGWRLFPLIAAAALFLSVDAARAGCDLKNAGKATIVEILNTESLLLEDGRAIRLVGTSTPRTQTRWAQAMGLESRIMAALQERLLGKEVLLRVGSRERDRYGRLMTHVFVQDGAEEIWVQQALVRDGLATVSSFADNRECARNLQAVERGAREAGAGFWEQGVFRVRDATDLDSLDGLAYSFQIVEGRVEDVAENRGRIYMNFGDDWRTDFTATVAPSDRGAFDGSGIALPDLEGRIIRVRGWVERRNGPMIDVTHPEQIELVATQASGDSAHLQNE